MVTALPHHYRPLSLLLCDLKGQCFLVFFIYYYLSFSSLFHTFRQTFKESYACAAEFKESLCRYGARHSLKNELRGLSAYTSDSSSWSGTIAYNDQKPKTKQANHRGRGQSDFQS
jgi:hypothetical protein